MSLAKHAGLKPAQTAKRCIYPGNNSNYLPPEAYLGSHCHANLTKKDYLCAKHGFRTMITDGIRQTALVAGMVAVLGLIFQTITSGRYAAIK